MGGRQGKMLPERDDKVAHLHSLGYISPLGASLVKPGICCLLTHDGRSSGYLDVNAIERCFHEMMRQVTNLRRDRQRDLYTESWEFSQRVFY